MRYVHVFYSSRALEWLNIRQILLEMLLHFGLTEMVSLEQIAFSWSYDQNLSSRFYKPSAVFKHFSFVNLFDISTSCVCHLAKRVAQFLDVKTATESAFGSKPCTHVRTADLGIVQHPLLRAALKLGLNHIPLRPTHFRDAINVVIAVGTQIYELCQLHTFGLKLDTVIQFLKQSCLTKLQAAARCNKFGFKQSGPYLFDIPAVQNEMTWLLNHFYISGIDKASNNACFMCIRHIRFQAYQRLMGDDFTPCKYDGRWVLPTAIFDTVKSDLLLLLPESPPQYNSLPFLMATFKAHKQTYRWLTNAFRTVYSSIAVLLTIATIQVLEMIKSWAKKRCESYKNFLRTHTSIFWIIDSILQFTLNLPTQITDIYVADVTRCYESIPIEGPDNLLDALRFTIDLGFREAAIQHPKANNTL